MLCSWLRLLVCEPAHVTRLPGSASGPWFAGPHSPWSRPLAPLAPHGGARRFVRRLHSYYGQVRLLWSVHRRLRPPAFPARSLQNSARTVQRYPGSRPGGVSACQCLRRRGADLCLAIATWAVLPSAGRKASALRSWFSPLNGWPTLSPVNASLRPSRVAAHELGGGVVRYAFTAKDFHLIPPAGLPAHPSTPSFVSVWRTDQIDLRSGRSAVAFLPLSLSPLNDDALADFVLSCIVREVAPCPKPGS